jgi:hypothetical protein
MEEPQPAMDKITQEMKYRYSLVNYALKYGVSKASRRYNRARSYIYYWLKRFDGAIDSLAAQITQASSPSQSTYPGRDCPDHSLPQAECGAGIVGALVQTEGSGIHPSLRQFISRGTKGRVRAVQETQTERASSQTL